MIADQGGENDMIELVRPTIEHKSEALAFRSEFFDHGETIINGSELLDKMDSYEEWLQSVTNNTSKNTVNPNWVVTDTYFAVNEKGRIVGIIDLRHELNDFLTDLGHCGYSVRPSERRKGYACEMLSLIIIRAKEAGLTELQLSVERTNEPSVKTVIKNGGVYERSFDIEGKKADVYMIKLL
jgi:predicted acetyltransferase